MAVAAHPAYALSPVHRLLPSILVLCTTSAAACVCPPTPEAWLDVGFETPEQTFRTFQTGLRADYPVLEYRCLSSSCKRGNGASLMGYLEFRDELSPWFRRLAGARLVESRALGPKRHLLVVRFAFLWIERTFAIQLEAEELYELRIADTPLQDDYIDIRDSLALDRSRLTVSVPAEASTSIDDVLGVRVDTEWKIAGFEEVEPSTLP